MSDYLKDVRKREQLPRGTIGGADENTFHLPDFTCDGCAHGVFGKEPLHCLKCGGTRFTPKATRAAGPLAFAALIQQAIAHTQAVVKEAGQAGVSKPCLTLLEEATGKLRLGLSAFYEGETHKRPREDRR